LWKIIDTLFMKLSLHTELPSRLQVGHGLTLWHPYGVIINESAKIGKHATILHHVTIGNGGPTSDGETPIIGDNVTIGAGAKVIGGIQLGNNVTIGANAVVNKSFPDNAILVGIPAKNIQKNS
jgi:serine acetyltransferase